MINVKDVITLSDKNEYVVVSKADYEGKTYYYLIDINHEENMKFCYEESKEEKIALVEVMDQTLIQKLIVLFMKEVTKNFSKPE